MITLNKKTGILIPRTYENELFYKEIKAHLTRRFQNYNTPDYLVNEFYLESDKYLLVPRFFPVQDYVQCQIIDNSYDGKDIDIDHKIKFRNKLQEKGAEFMVNHDKGIVQLSPGTGKTVISIYAVCKRKKKTLILVHKDYLVRQWEERFLEHSTIEKEKIGRITSSNFKEFLNDRDVLIITDQTFTSLLKRKRFEFLTELRNANIGILISDECHTTVGAPTFSECSIHVPAKVVFGLSATPYRYDGNNDIIKYHLGEVFSDSSTDGTMPAKVNIILTDYKIDIPFRYKYLHWGGDFQRSRYLNLMRKSDPFLKVAKGLLDKFKGSKKILFMSERLNLIDILFKWFDHDSKAKFISGSPDSALKESVIFGTPGKLRDGVDVPDIDCLIMTSPISNIEQMCGRVIRDNPDKDIPVIVDIVDSGCKYINRTLYKRIDFYESKEWDVQYLLVTDKGIEKIDKNTAIEFLK